MDAKVMAQFSASAEEAERLRKIDEETSAEDQQGQRLKNSGTFVMTVDTGFFYNKKANNKLVLLPDIVESSTGSAMLLFRLKVCDGKYKDHTVLTNLVFYPKPGSSPEVAGKIFSMSKPRIAAMIGTDQVKLSDFKWCVENMAAEWDLTGPKPILKRDHKLKAKVKVIIEDDLDNNGNERLKVKSIFRALPTDVSVPNEKATEPKQAATPTGHTFAGQASADKPAADISAFVSDDDIIPTVSDAFEG